MSIRIMSAIWENGPEAQGQMLVMLALSDYANDEGICWPAIKSIARKARMSERGVQKIIRVLEADGWLKISTGNGRKGCNQYTIITPNHVHPRTQFTPNVDTETPNVDVKNPEPRSPEPSGTVKETSSSNSEARLIRSALEEFASPSAVTSFIAYRRKQKGKSLTETAALRQASQLSKILDQGGDADDALGMAEERGWVSVQANWYFNAKRKGNYDNRSHGNTQNGNRSGASTARSGPSDGFAAVAARYANE